MAITYANKKHTEQSLEIIEKQIGRLKVDNSMPKNRREQELEELLNRRSVLRGVLERIEIDEK